MSDLFSGSTLMCFSSIVGSVAENQEARWFTSRVCLDLTFNYVFIGVIH